MKKFKIASALIAFLLPAILHAEVAVIVSHDNKNTYTSIDKELISRIFLGQTASFPNDSVARPINLKQGNEVRTYFNQYYLGKSESQLSAYWAKLRFSGKARLPKTVSSVQEMKALIANDPTLIGYIDALDVDSTIKVVHQY